MSRRRIVTELLDKLPPHSDPAEIGVLGSILLLPALLPRVLLSVSVGDFRVQQNRAIFQSYIKINACGKRPDILLVKEALIASGWWDKIGELYIAEIMEKTPTAAHAVYYAQIVRDKAKLRRLLYAGLEIVQLAHSGLEAPEAIAKAKLGLEGI